jgi:hypothetical protein
VLCVFDNKWQVENKPCKKLTNANWGGDVDSKKSTRGYFFTLRGTPIA